MPVTDNVERERNGCVCAHVDIALLGTEWSFAPGIWSRAQIRGWKGVTDAVHKQGGLIVCQLWHLGRLNHPLLQAGQPIYGPSPVAAKGGNFRQLNG